MDNQWHVAELRVRLVLAPRSPRLLRAHRAGCGPQTSPIRSFTAGVLVGLGIYQHGSAALLAAALGVLVITTRGVRSRSLGWLGLGAALGAVPIVVAQVFPPQSVVYSPVSSPEVNVPLYLQAMGLSLREDAWPVAVMPNVVGVNAGPPIVSEVFSFLVMCGFTLCVAVGATLGLVAAMHHRHVTDRHRLAAAWLAGCLALFALTLVLRPAWFYGTCLSFLVWLSLAVLSTARGRARRWRPASRLAVGLLAVLTVIAWWPVLSDLPGAIAAKADASDELHRPRKNSTPQGPSTCTGTTGRCSPRVRVRRNSPGHSQPLQPVPAGRSVPPGDTADVAIDLHPTSAWGREALATASKSCVATGSTVASTFGMYQCPLSLLMVTQ